MKAVTAATGALAILLATEYTFAPVNLWTGRTIATYQRFTGLSVGFARRILAPFKLVTAILLVAGLASRQLAIAGAAASTAICTFYLIRLVRPTGRDATGLVAFGIFGALSFALLMLQIAR